MAATIARAQGFGRNGVAQNQEATRLGHGHARAEANTFYTFASATIRADGSGFVTVRRFGELIHEFAFGPEREEGTEVMSDEE